jgi:hypothetical protein
MACRPRLSSTCCHVTNGERVWPCPSEELREPANRLTLKEGSASCGRFHGRFHRHACVPTPTGHLPTGSSIAPSRSAGGSTANDTTATVLLLLATAHGLLATLANLGLLATLSHALCKP